MDSISSERRSANMRAIRSKGMKPELAVRQAVYGLGYRYRLHRRDLPGKPDLAFVGKKKAIFVNGCFWHQHEKCRDGSLPKSNQGYWNAKLKRNVERDSEDIGALEVRGWSVLTIWECDLADQNALIAKLERFLDAE